MNEPTDAPNSPTPELAMVEVTQADRDAAARAREQEYAQRGYSPNTLETPTEMRRGQRDWDALVQEKARHRLAAIPTDRPMAGDGEGDDIRRNIIRQLGDDPNADRVILPGTDWDIVLAALTSARADQGSGETIAVCGACRGAGRVSRWGFRLSAAKVLSKYRDMSRIIFGDER